MKRRQITVLCCASGRVQKRVFGPSSHISFNESIFSARLASTKSWKLLVQWTKVFVSNETRFSPESDFCRGNVFLWFDVWVYLEFPSFRIRHTFILPYFLWFFLHLKIIELINCSLILFAFLRPHPSGEIFFILFIVSCFLRNLVFHLIFYLYNLTLYYFLLNQLF